MNRQSFKSIFVTLLCGFVVASCGDSDNGSSEVDITIIPGTPLVSEVDFKIDPTPNQTENDDTIDVQHPTKK